MWTSPKPAAIAAVLVLFMAGCDGGGEPEAVTPEPPPEPAAEAAPAPASLADIFPEGLGRTLVMDSCGSCHAVACSAIGQRTAGRWKALETDHRDRVADMSDADYRALFEYLSANFSDAQPEPTVPPQFLEGGCTPF